MNYRKIYEKQIFYANLAKIQVSSGFQSADLTNVELAYQYYFKKKFKSEKDKYENKN